MILKLLNFTGHLRKTPTDALYRKMYTMYNNTFYKVYEYITL